MSVLMKLALYLFGIGSTPNLAVSHTATTLQQSEKRLKKETLVPLVFSIQEYAWDFFYVKHLYKHGLDPLYAPWLTVALEGYLRGRVPLPVSFHSGGTVTDADPSHRLQWCAMRKMKTCGWSRYVSSMLWFLLLFA